MFDKLAPTPITNTKHRTILVVAMVWFFVGVWIDSSAHTYLLDLENIKLRHRSTTYGSVFE